MEIHFKTDQNFRKCGRLLNFFFFTFKSACMEKQWNKLFNVEIKRVLFDEG